MESYAFAPFPERQGALSVADAAAVQRNLLATARTLELARQSSHIMAGKKPCGHERHESCRCNNGIFF